MAVTKPKSLPENIPAGTGAAAATGTGAGAG